MNAFISKTISKTANLFAAFLLLTLVAVKSHASATESSEIAVVVNPLVQSDALSHDTLGRIYAMQVRAWPDGTPIKVFTFSPHSLIFKEFAMQKARIQPHQLDRHWNRLIFTGKGRTPEVVENMQQMIEKVSNTPGAIGFLYKADIEQNIKVISVGEGK